METKQLIELQMFDVKYLQDSISSSRCKQKKDATGSAVRKPVY
jgi:hypothetical protein